MLTTLRHNRRLPVRLSVDRRCALPHCDILCYHPPILRTTFGTGWPVGAAALRGEGASTRDRPARRDLLVQSPSRRSVVHVAATAPRVSLTDLSRRLNLPISSLQHECYKLEKNQILIARRSGNARLYRVDPRNLLIEPLTSLIVKAIGPDAALRGAIDGVDGMELVFITGDDVSAGARLVVVGDLELEALDSLTARAETALGSAPNTVEIAFFSRTIGAHALPSTTRTSGNCLPDRARSCTTRRAALTDPSRPAS